MFFDMKRLGTLTLSDWAPCQAGWCYTPGPELRKAASKHQSKSNLADSQPAVKHCGTSRCQDALRVSRSARLTRLQSWQLRVRADMTHKFPKTKGKHETQWKWTNATNTQDCCLAKVRWLRLYQELEFGWPACARKCHKCLLSGHKLSV